MHTCTPACSGNRSITLTGSYMDFVDGVQHGLSTHLLDVRPPTNSSFQVSPPSPPPQVCSGITRLFMLCCDWLLVSSTFPFPVSKSLTYDTPEHLGIFTTYDVLLKVANETLACPTLAITYHPDPQFSSFTTLKTKNGIRFTIQVPGPQVKLLLQIQMGNPEKKQPPFVSRT